MTVQLAKELRDEWNQKRGYLEPTPGLHDRTTYQNQVWEVYRDADTVGGYITKDAYNAFMRQLAEQWQFMLDAGVVIEFQDSDPDYVDADGKISSKSMFDQVNKTHVLRVWRSEDGFHPLLDTQHVDYRGRQENFNSIFRAVHDWFGHCATGAGFGWKGETRAYLSHSSMFTEDAIPALFCETVAQQCGYAVTGNYVDQKCVWFGPGWWNPPL